MERVFILLEGGNVDLNQFNFNKNDIFICADGGIKRILDRKLKNKIIYIGDFDSVEKEVIKKYNFEIKEFSKDKNKTDGELAIEYTCKNFNKNIKKIIIGGITDRLDHTIGNILVCIPKIKEGHKFEFYGDKIKCYLASKSITLETRINNKISLIALEKISNAQTSGLKWELKNEDIFSYNSRTLRNESIKSLVKVKFDKGILMIIETW